MNSKLSFVAMVSLIVAVVVGGITYYFVNSAAYQRGYAEGYVKGEAVGTVKGAAGVSESVVNPMENVPEANPYAGVETNPFAAGYTNPFE